MNTAKYPWLCDLTSPEAASVLAESRRKFQTEGAVTFPHFLTEEALQAAVADCRAQEDAAFTTDDTHTAYLQAPDTQRYPANSIYNHEMRTQVASIAFDELSKESPLVQLYQHPILLQLVSSIVQKEPLYLSADPIGCCSINVFRPGYHHSFHFDESEFSTTIMLQEASDTNTGLFQFTRPLRDKPSDLALAEVAGAIETYDDNSCGQSFAESSPSPAAAVDGVGATAPPLAPQLHTLDFKPGTLSIFSGSRSLHRVTQVKGARSRLVAVLTFASTPEFVNTPETQKMFWGRASEQQKILD